MKYVGNTGNLIDWESVIDDLKKSDPAHTGPNNSVSDPSEIVGMEDLMNKWTKAGVKTVEEGGTNRWDMFFPGQQFSADVVSKFCDFVNADATAAWIARITPGNMAHWHWDTSSHENEFNAIPNMVRYCCFIMKSQPGHVFMTEEGAYCNQEQGSVYQWPSRTMWHGGLNCGMTEKYMFHFFGPAR